jgi:hypothetical protein
MRTPTSIPMIAQKRDEKAKPFTASYSYLISFAICWFLVTVRGMEHQMDLILLAGKFLEAGLLQDFDDL